MRNQRLIMNIKWHDKVRNVEIATQTSFPHIGTIIQRHTLFGHVVRLDSNTPANQALALHRDINEGRRVNRDGVAHAVALAPLGFNK